MNPNLISPDKPFIYLASPFTSHSKQHVTRKEVEQDRYKKVSLLMARLIKLKNIVYCPIATSYHLHTHYGADMAHDEWMDLDFFFLDRCDILMVHCIDGWEESCGVHEEIIMAKELKKPIIYIPDSLYGA